MAELKNKDLREKILAYNRKVQQDSGKASDLDVIVQALMQMPYGQLKKVMTDEVLAIIEKYGIIETEETARSGPY